MIGEPDRQRPGGQRARVRRGKEVRSALILRVFAVERFIRALIFAALAIAVWRFSVSRLSLEESYDQALPPLKTLLRDLGFSVEHSKVLGLINKAFTTDPRILAYLAIGCAAYAAVEVIEGIGLWLLKRWGEYFAMVATSVGLPYRDLRPDEQGHRAPGGGLPDQPGPGPLPGADQAPVRRARRQGRRTRPGCAASPSWTPRSPPSLRSATGNRSRMRNPGGMPDRRPPGNLPPARNRPPPRNRPRNRPGQARKPVRLQMRVSLIVTALPPLPRRHPAP